MKYRLAIFDMDGTLTEELLDFPAIRRDIGLAGPGGIIEHIAQLGPEDQKRALEILHRHECAAADSCGLNDGALHVVATLRDKGIKTALLTRNSAESVRRVFARHGLVLDHISSREDAPHKPHPDSILNIARKFAIDPKETLMIGDYLYDLQAAHAAGADSALLLDPDDPNPDWADLATYRIAHLNDLLKIIEPSATTAHSK
jgi:HAD superfamily hydrolase (TIGR01549 family)